MANKWVEEAVKCFITDVAGLDPTDPVKAIEAYFDKNASEDLKALARTENKTAKECWEFVNECANSALHGHSGHVDQTAVYAIAMHWFKDVPKTWRGDSVNEQPKAPKPMPAAEHVACVKPKAPKPEQRKRKAKSETQGFFFDVLEETEEKHGDD